MIEGEGCEWGGKIKDIMKKYGAFERPLGGVIA